MKIAIFEMMQSNGLLLLSPLTYFAAEYSVPEQVGISWVLWYHTKLHHLERLSALSDLTIDSFVYMKVEKLSKTGQSDQNFFKVVIT